MPATRWAQRRGKGRSSERQPFIADGHNVPDRQSPLPGAGVPSPRSARDVTGKPGHLHPGQTNPGWDKGCKDDQGSAAPVSQEKTAGLERAGALEMHPDVYGGGSWGS